MKRQRAHRLVFVLAFLGVSFAVFGGIALANHSLYQQISEGEINGNGSFDASFDGVSSDGTRAFFRTAEKLVSTDTDSAFDLYERSGGSTKRVSAGQINGNGAFDALFRGASADGTRVFFTTVEQLIPGDTDSESDVYERSAGSTKRVSAGQINGNGAFAAFFVGASADGTRVFFATIERLVSSDTDSSLDVYERSGGSTKRVSVGQINGNGTFGATFVGASADGTRVFFTTTEQLVSGDIDGSPDIYERSSGSTKRVSAGQINGNGVFAAFFGGASADGTRVFFTTTEQLVSTDTESETDLYERSGGSTKRVSAGQINGNGTFGVGFAGASSDGTRVFFTTLEKLVSTDNDSSLDIYERSGGSTKRVSAGQINGNGAFDAHFAGSSSDGTRVFFTTFERLVSTDTDGAGDVYERSSGSTKHVSAGQINGNANFIVSFSRASADGTRVLFTTLEQLVPGDTDGSEDVYERSGGTTSRISRGNGSFPALFAGGSADGSAVFFITVERVFADDVDLSVDIYGAYIAP